MNSREVIAGNHQISFRLPSCCLNGWSILRLRLKHHTPAHSSFVWGSSRPYVSLSGPLSVCQVFPAPLSARPYVRLATSRLNLSDGSHLGSRSNVLPLMKAGRRIRFLPFFVSFFSSRAFRMLVAMTPANQLLWLKWDQYHHPAYHLF